MEKGLLHKQIMDFFVRNFDVRQDKEDELDTIESIKKGVEFKGTNLWVLIFATFVASLGLNTMQLVSEETGRLARLIQNMLDLSKLESGEYQVNARMFNIWETITGVALSAEQRINDGMIDIDGLTMDEKVLVYADPDLIHQVVYNLLDNAIKFTPAGGTIRFGVEKLPCRTCQYG